MLGLEEVMSELGEELNEQGLPPGFRFHPTDEELITFYLASKVFNGSFSGLEIAEVDLNKCEPWELPERAKLGKREWYFYTLRDRKYPTGLRTNRATSSGYWKATGKDKEVYGKAAATGTLLLGMKKTLVFYKGRAPRGVKTNWVMHEYRLHHNLSFRQSTKEEWVICRLFHKTVEKKSVPMQGQSPLHHLDTAASLLTSSLPPLLESSLLESQTHNSYVGDHYNYCSNQFIKSWIKPAEPHPSLYFSTNDQYSQTSLSIFSSAAADNSFKHGESCFHKDQNMETITKQLKTDCAPSQFQIPENAGTAAIDNINLCWANRVQQDPYLNPLFHEVESANYGLLGLSPGGLPTFPDDISSLGRSSFETLNSQLRQPTGESWPFDHCL